MATFMGIVLVILGVCVLAAPVAVGAAAVMIVGGLMAIAGLIECFHALRARTMPSRVTWLLVGLVTLICGVLVMAHPILGLGFLTILLAVYFFADGFMKIVAAFNFTAHRGRFIFGGILSFILAYLIWSNWPLSGGWAVGILVGVNLIFTGALVLAVGSEL
ncbi:MAG: DUF308 domain-containing protein [Candidatus Omnitrophica bacterium]|nr:DUF308 domain-containing protein [Candidatus Omnitrophota bacterium]MBU4488324.1 DUF308 domain-containing protein [Candidatus Omnitrophota bacterium]MCG2704974.1 DUF308 domain-containing protein [Candidatus Omnitrophota bacterium]